MDESRWNAFVSSSCITQSQWHCSFQKPRYPTEDWIAMITHYWWLKRAGTTLRPSSQLPFILVTLHLTITAQTSTGLIMSVNKLSTLSKNIGFKGVPPVCLWDNLYSAATGRHTHDTHWCFHCSWHLLFTTICVIIILCFGVFFQNGTMILEKVKRKWIIKFWHG